MRSGIYIVKFSSHQDIYKIGMSKDIDSRVEQFKRSTTNLDDVELIYSKEFEDYSKAEKTIHELLKDYRVREDREFFQGDVNVFIDIIESMNPDDFKKKEIEINPIITPQYNSQSYFLSIILDRISSILDKHSDTISVLSANQKSTLELFTSTQEVLNSMVSYVKDLDKEITELKKKIEKLEKERAPKPVTL